jgi:hypothetical protein
MEILAICVLAYFLVSPDKMSLAFSRGALGAGRGAITGRTPKATKDSKPSPRGRAILAGWREGVTAARERREAGRDLWSRGTRFGGRISGGTASLARGINDTIHARRDQTDDPGLDGAASPDAVPSRRGWTMPRLVRRPRTAPTSDASGLVVDQDGNDVASGDCSRCGKPALVDSDTGTAHRICLDCWEKENGHPTEVVPTEDTVTEPQVTAEPDPGPGPTEPATPQSAPAPATRTDPNGVITMPNQTELATLDELSAELKAMENAFTDLTELVARIKKYGANLPDRWSATNWGTKGLDRAITDISEEIASIKLIPLESFATARTEIGKARTLGETADAVQAHGKTEAFRSN